MSPTRTPSCRAGLALAATGLMLALAAPARQAVAADTAESAAAPASAPQEFSRAERLLLMSDQLAGLKPPTTLKYSFRKSGPLEPGFDDHVDVTVKPQPDGSCCVASGDFLSGDRRLSLPEVEKARGNPVILYFLEHDIREMKRLTKGATAYFRKRIRMALFEGATVRDVQLNYRGKTVPGQEIEIRPYTDDPNRARFEQFTGKQYLFLLSPEVPGGVASIRSTVTEPGAKQPFLEEELWLEGAEARPRAGRS